MRIIETEVCSFCGAPDISKISYTDYIGVALTDNKLLSEPVTSDDVYCFACQEYGESVPALLVYYEGKLYTISKVHKDYRIVEVMYKHCKHKDDVLYFEREVQKVAEIPALDVEYDPYIDTEKFIKEIFSRTGRQ